MLQIVESGIALTVLVSIFAFTGIAVVNLNPSVASSDANVAGESTPSFSFEPHSENIEVDNSSINLKVKSIAKGKNIIKLGSLVNASENKDIRYKITPVVYGYALDSVTLELRADDSSKVIYLDSKAQPISILLENSSKSEITLNIYSNIQINFPVRFKLIAETTYQ